jgi:hypothetical protein
LRRRNFGAKIYRSIAVIQRNLEVVTKIMNDPVYLSQNNQKSTKKNHVDRTNKKYFIPFRVIFIGTRMISEVMQVICIWQIWQIAKIM